MGSRVGADQRERHPARTRRDSSTNARSAASSRITATSGARSRSAGARTPGPGPRTPARVKSAWAAAGSAGGRRRASRSSVTGTSERSVTSRFESSACWPVLQQPLAVGGPLHLVRVLEHLLDTIRTRAPGRARPCRRCRARRARCPPRRPPGPARPPRARAARRTSPPPGAVVERRRPRPRGRGSGRSTSSFTSCSRSLSPETTTTWWPCSTACRARVAITSSASKPAELEDRQPEDVADPAHVRELHPEVVVHPPAVGLVLRVLLVAEGGPGQVEARCRSTPGPRPGTACAAWW